MDRKYEVPGYTTTFEDVSDETMLRDLKKYVKKHGIEKAKREYNEVFKDWEKKSANHIFNELVAKNVPFMVVRQWDRIIKRETVKLMRRILGMAIREVRVENGE